MLNNWFNDKINIEIIKQFKEAFKYRKEADKESLEIYLNEDTKKEYASITWLYECRAENVCLIGFNEESIYAIDSEGWLVGVCEGLENIPYELLRVESRYAEDELVEDVFDYDKDFLTDLSKYEEWCKNNCINLDVQKIYHDEHGDLFKQYFDKN